MRCGSRSAFNGLRRGLALLGALLLLPLSASPAVASELQVYPVRLTLGPQAQTALLTALNHGQNDTLLQIAIFNWSQPGGTDKLDPTRDVLANPPIFPLKGGAQQVVRFGLRVPQTDVERTYRFMLQEVPQPRPEGFNGLATLLKMSIPIFVPPAAPNVAVAWRLRATPKGALLVITNSGNVHVQLRQIQLAAGGASLFDKTVNVYVLPGVERVIPLDLARPIAAGTSVDAKLDTDQKPFAMTLQAEPSGNGTAGN